LYNEIGLKQKIKEELKIDFEKLKEKSIRNILIIGEEGKGKSTLANVLCGSTFFYENHSGNRHQEIERKQFDIDWMRYQVIDTAGIKGENIENFLNSNLPEDLSSLTKLSEFVNLIKRGINQIFLVIDAGSLSNSE